MTNTIFRNEITESIQSFRVSRQDRRNEYLNLRQAGVDTKRVQYAVQDFGNGMLSKSEAKEMMEMAENAIYTYNYALGDFGDFRVAPILLRVLAIVVGLMAELVATGYALDLFWSVASHWPSALYWGTTVVIFFAVAAAFDVGGFFGFNALCSLFMKVRIARLCGYREALKSFVEQ